MDPYVRERWRRNRYRGHGGLVGGVILAGIGVLLLLQNLGIPYFEDLERYWPVILIVVGAVQAARSMGMGGRIWGGMLFAIGFLFLMNNIGVIHGDVWRFLWPGILIMMGLGMLARAVDRQSQGGSDAGASVDHAKRMGESIKERILSDIHGRTGAGRTGASGASGASGPFNSVNHLSEWAVFGGTRRRVDSQDFQGGELFALFGGVEIDLRKAATTREELLIEANALFGGIDIRVPETWSVTVRGSGIFGGYEDETMDSRAVPDPKQPRLILTGFAIFGGVHVKN